MSVRSRPRPLLRASPSPQAPDSRPQHNDLRPSFSPPNLHPDFFGKSTMPGVSQPSTRGTPIAHNGSTVVQRRPLYQPPGVQHEGARRNRPTMRQNEEWKKWEKVCVKVMQLPRRVTTLAIYKLFAVEGSIAEIKIVDGHGYGDAAAFITFRPPPFKSFWQFPAPRVPSEASGIYTSLKLELRPKPKTYFHPSPVNKTLSYPERTVLFATWLDFGIMYSESAMMRMETVTPQANLDISFMLHLNSARQELDIRFPLHVPDRSQQKATSLRLFSFRLPLARVKRVYEVSINDDRRELIIPLESPHEFYRKTTNIEKTHDSNSMHWSERRTWFRQTDIVTNYPALQSDPVRLKQENATIDIGRWTTYRFIFNTSGSNKVRYSLVRRALTDYNIAISENDKLDIVPRQDTTIWTPIDSPRVNLDNTASALSTLDSGTAHLPFPVRYQLEVCLSHGYLNEHNLSGLFIQRLADVGGTAANILEKVAEMKRRFYNPMDVFNIGEVSRTANRVVPNYCILVRSATVTPSMVLFSTPSVEISNRIIRQFYAYEDRFLRVRFSDENNERVSAPDDNTQNEVYVRIKRAMVNGILIGDRHYEFLAFGNSQFREHGAYFFAPTEDLTAEDIRMWMGDLRHIDVVAKWAARLGQSFSTTRAITTTTVKVVTMPDVKRNGFCFTDGVGKISKFLAQMIANELGLPDPFENPPSLFQFRLGGCKGVLAVANDARMQEIYIRPSQYKFAAVHEGLEIIRTSQFATAYLNRQIIIILSALGVPDDVFRLKLEGMLSELTNAMVDENVALRLLQKNIDFNQTTLTVAAMILDGFMKTEDPFTTSILQLWRSWNIKYLKEKARIMVEKGAFLLGCVDETATLKGHYESLQPQIDAPKEEKEKFLPEIFLQIPDVQRKGVYTVIQGICILARNPSLHPGDVRIVKAVDVPALRHLKDVVVLPQTGDRDIANMCSGGDLDGDDYLIMWDEDLLPTEWNHSAMDFKPQHPITVDRGVTIDDVTDFFVTYMKNDKLPQIALAHLAQADFSELGPKDEKCLELAQLHSCAVDFPKSGIPAGMSADLRPRKWPHFMEKKISQDRIYHSNKVLGQLYDMVEKVSFAPQYETPFDERILGAYDLDDDILRRAAEVKKDWDAAIRRIMAQYAIATEFEVWSVFVLAHNLQRRDYSFAEELGKITHAVKERFRKLCHEKAGGSDFAHLGPFVAAMYTVAAKEFEAAVAECHTMKMVGGKEVPVRKMEPQNMPLMSFPWIFVSELGKIANGEMAGRGAGIIPLQGVQKRTHLKKNTATSAEPGQDNIQTREGVVHRGELLNLFDDAPETLGEEHEAAPEDKHAAMVERGIVGPSKEQPHDAEPILPPTVVHRDWAPEEEVLGMLQSLSLEDKDEEQSNRSEHPSPPEESTRSPIVQLQDDLLDLEDGAEQLPLPPTPVSTSSKSLNDVLTLPNSSTRRESMVSTSSRSLLDDETDDEGGDEEQVQIELDEKPSALEALDMIVG